MLVFWSRIWTGIRETDMTSHAISGIEDTVVRILAWKGNLALELGSCILVLDFAGQKMLRIKSL